MTFRTWQAWPTAIAAATAVGLLLMLVAVQRGRGLPMFLVHLAIVVLVAGAAYLLDDNARPVTDVVPTSLVRRRSVIVAQGLGVIAGGWAVMLALVSWLPESGAPQALTWEVAGLSWIAIAASAVVSLTGEAEPGNMVATALALVVTATLIVQPIIDVPILATSAGDPVYGGWWLAAIVISAVTFVVASVGVGRRRSFGRRRVAGPLTARQSDTDGSAVPD